MNRATKLVTAGTLIAGLGAVGVWLVSRTAGSADGMSPAARLVSAERSDAERAYARQDFARAEKELIAVVAKHGTSDDPQVQDQVGATRLRLGYAAARQGDYDRARTYFQTAQAEYRGTGFTSPDFGGVEDQAAYQAAVCLSASGKEQDAIQEFERFLNDHPDSPLVKAAHRRLLMLDPKQRGRYDKHLQEVLATQAAKARLERATCGPKALSYLLKKLGKGDVRYQTLAAECGTTEEGTSLAGMRKALTGRGINAYGYEVNRTDFAKLPLPAFWLRGDHYLVIERITTNGVALYDPTQARQLTEALPADQNNQFLATVLCLEPLQLSGTQK